MSDPSFDGLGLDAEELDRMVTRAEAAHALEAVADIKRYLDRLAAAQRIAREALWFYADPTHHSGGLIADDRGAVARKALARLSRAAQE